MTEDMKNVPIMRRMQELSDYSFECLEMLEKEADAAHINKDPHYMDVHRGLCLAFEFVKLQIRHLKSPSLKDW
jgi:hypothetical protein